MGYSPPPGSAVTFNFTTLYSPPYGLTVVFNFGAISPPSGNANVFRALQSEIDEEAAWHDPRARQFYTVSVAPAAAIYPFVRRDTAAAMLVEQDDWRDPRGRQFYAPVPQVSVTYPFVRRAAMLDSDDAVWTDPRSRMRYNFPVAVAVVVVRPVLFTVM
jgi:hypothetical protein